MKRWTEAQIPDMQGQIVLVTGANGGLGFATAKAFAAHNAVVVMACRDTGKAEAAAEQVRAAHPDATLEVLALDLANIESVRSAAHEFPQRHPRLDILCNNAGVLGLPLQRTRDGFEMVFGVNHLGHFALTVLLMPALASAPNGRVVSVSSLTHRRATLPLDDLNWELRSYRKSAAYAQSKLANLLFMRELDRRLQEAGSPVRSVAAHPGIAATDIAGNMASMLPAPLKPLWRYAVALNNRLLAQPAAMGMLPTLYAATVEDVQGGALYGPDGWFEIRGYPKRIEPSSRALDADLASALWARSEALTGVRWDAT